MDFLRSVVGTLRRVMCLAQNTRKISFCQPYILVFTIVSPISNKFSETKTTLKYTIF